jgi:phage FluMu gp28-like protein
MTLETRNAKRETRNDEAMIRFDASQRRLFADESRVIVVNWHRQKGKDFTASAKAVDHAMRTGQTWYIVSLTQRQADATFDKCKKVAEAFKRMLKVAGHITESAADFVDRDAEIDQEFACTARTLTLPNGGKVVSLPGKNPDTLAGLTGNVIFTEFGLFPGGGYGHWRVIFPLTTRGYQVIVISTPRNKKTKFFELCSDPETYSYHFCDIYQSVEQEGFILKDNKGRPCTIDDFKKVYRDDAGFDREYGCLFTGDLEALIKWAQILSSQDPDLVVRILRVNNGVGWKDDFFAEARNLPGGGRMEFGWDVARHKHFSSFWGNLSRRDGKKELRFLVLMNETEFATQRHIITRGMDARPGSVGCGDATGLGMDSNETLSALYRDAWEAVTFGVKSKSELGSLGRTAFGDGIQKLPVFGREAEAPGLALVKRDGDVVPMVPARGKGTDVKFIATDLYSIQCEQTGDQADKRLLLKETENELEPNSHCDIAYSGLLALKAGTLRGGRNAPLPAALAKKPRGW